MNEPLPDIMKPQAPTVFVVDDDDRARDSVCALVQSMGVPAKAFSSAEEFLASDCRHQPGCLVTDLRMFGMSGVELQDRLKQEEIPLPVIVLTAFARTSLTVRVMQNGAVTLLEKPYDDDDLWNGIRKAIAIDASRRAEYQRRQHVVTRLESLTMKEREVLNRVVAGKPNKIIARELGVSIRTVENRRRDVYTKMGVTSIVDLVKLAIEAGVDI